MGLKDKRQVGKNHHFGQSFGHAFDGLVVLWRTERNFRFHVCSAVGILLVAFILHATIVDYLWLSLAILIVLIVETINSIIERVVDLFVGHHYNPLAKVIKDLAAGAVLLTAWLAVIIGLLVLIPLGIKLI